jgi:hypothetical protein
MSNRYVSTLGPCEGSRRPLAARVAMSSASVMRLATCVACMVKSTQNRRCLDAAGLGVPIRRGTLHRDSSSRQCRLKSGNGACPP